MTPITPPSRPTRLTPKAGAVAARPILAVTALAILLWWVFAWVESGRHFDGSAADALSRARLDAEMYTQGITFGIQRSLSLMHGIPSTLARDERVRRALAPPVAPPVAPQGEAAVRAQLGALNEFLAATAGDLGVVSARADGAERPITRSPAGPCRNPRAGTPSCRRRTTR